LSTVADLAKPIIHDKTVVTGETYKIHFIGAISNRTKLVIVERISFYT
jgi:hypothetical protein